MKDEVTIEPTRDVAYVDRWARDPEVYERSATDESPARESVTLGPAVRDMQNVVLKVSRGGEEAGLLFLRRDGFGYELHAALGRNCRGAAAIEAGRQAVQWAFERAGAWVVWCHCPDFNRPALVAALRCGFRRLAHVPVWARKGGRDWGTTVLSWPGKAWPQRATKEERSALCRS